MKFKVQLFSLLAGGALVLAIGMTPSALAGIPGIPSVPVPKPPVTAPPLPQLPKLPELPIPDVSQLLGGQDVISTNIADAVTGIPFLNDYQPFETQYLDSSHKTAQGTFQARSGSYFFEARSYCLHAGKHGLINGTGYLLAPLKGLRAPMVHDILVKSADHLDIPQTQVQQLIWAILARARFSSLAPQLQLAAAKLLTPTQILLLDHEAIGVVPDDKLAGMLAKIPDPVRDVVQAENSLRGLLTSNGTYEQMERFAVLPTMQSATTTVAPIRWSFDPHGYFVSYLPHGYQWTTNYYDIPGSVLSSEDALGRVGLLYDRRGNTITFNYSPGNGVVVPGDAEARFYQLRSIKFAWRDLVGGKSVDGTETWPTSQWVMAGIPNGRGQLQSSASVNEGGQRYAAASALRDQFAHLLHTVHGNASALSGLLALAELRPALAAAVDGKRVLSPRIAEQLNFPFAAWESALTHSVGGRIAAHVDAGIDDNPDPAGGVANPQNPLAQRLAQSPAQAPPQSGNCPGLPPGSGNPTQQNIANAFSTAGYPGPAQAPQDIAYTDVWPPPAPNLGMRNYSVNLDVGGGPVKPCDPGYWKIIGSITESHMYDISTNKQYDVWQASADIYQQGQFVASGTGLPFGDPQHGSGTMEEAIVSSLDKAHYKF